MPMENGTELTFLPSPETFTKTEFDYSTLEDRFRELAFLNSGVNLIFRDERGMRQKNQLYYEGGISFVDWLDRAKTPYSNPRSP